MAATWRRRILRSLLIAAGVLLVIAIAGAIYQSVTTRRALARFPPPGRLIDVGGRRLHLLCIGEGAPTVIFEPSGLGGALSAERARTALAATTRVCSYDRMGTGWSEPGPAVITIGALADDLHRLIDGAGLQPPFIIVPASVGGLTAELFTRRHPERVAGIVFLDAASSEALDRAVDMATSTRVAAVCLLPTAARVGLLRLIDPLGLRQDPSPGSERGRALIYRAEPMSTFCGLARGVDASVAEFRPAPPLPPALPMIVLTAETNNGLVPPMLTSLVGADITPARRVAHQRLAARSSRGVWQIVPKSDHLIGSSQPDAVVTAVLEIIRANR